MLFNAVQYRETETKQSPGHSCHYGGDDELMIVQSMDQVQMLRL